MFLSGNITKIAVAALSLSLLSSSAAFANASSEPDAGSGQETERETICQVSLLQGLTLGDYHGSVSVAELKRRGDTGLGTFDALNGEMIVLDGTVFRAAGDGSVQTVPDEELVPFSNVTFFDADETQPVSNVGSIEELKALLDNRAGELGANRFYMVRIDGTFSEVNVRSEWAQEEPYRPLAEVLEHDQTFFDYANEEGTVVGLYCPSYMKNMNAAGWHLHYISKDRKRGGHVLGINVRSAELSWDYTDNFMMLLPETEMFSGFDLTVDQSDDIRRVETDVKKD